ncbi:hypothetical protein ACP4OV_007909 [Aristida adscensionis]
MAAVELADLAALGGDDTARRAHAWRCPRWSSMVAADLSKLGAPR